MSRFLHLVLAILPATLIASCVATPPASVPAPAAVATVQPFVIAANPLAARAGIDVLARGGSAVDAAVAVQAMLSLVEPQSSGIGGGAFINYFEAGTGKIRIYDGREVAPAMATPTMFLDAGGKPLPFDQAVVSGRATGVPGAVKMLAVAHAAHGKLPWSSLFGDARRTAAVGFIVSPRLARLVHLDTAEIKVEDARNYFSRPDGRLVEAGDRLRNPAYADFLDRLARLGPDALYRGETAARIVAKTRAAPLGGAMTMADLAAYQPVERTPLCRPYRVYLACVPPPPSSGVGLLALLGLLERTDIATRNANDAQAWFLFAEASRVMYADRDRYIGDPAFTSVPTAGLVDPAYLDRRVRLIGQVAGPPPVAGTPPGAASAATDTTREVAGTSHFIVGDGAGNVVSMTTTVESIFGSGRMVDGFFLNNEMTDFAFQPVGADGRPSANAVAPGKRPRSSMTPLILLDANGRFAGAIGSAGGNAILAFVGKSLTAAVDWGQPMQAAIALPNLVARGNSFGGEVTKFLPAILAALRARGVDIKPGQGEDSGVHGVIIRDGRVDGGYDPRREGVVLTLPAAAPR